MSTLLPEKAQQATTAESVDGALEREVRRIEILERSEDQFWQAVRRTVVTGTAIAIALAVGSWFMATLLAVLSTALILVRNRQYLATLLTIWDDPSY